jgi:hypothetical protein
MPRFSDTSPRKRWSLGTRPAGPTESTRRQPAAKSPAVPIAPRPPRPEYSFRSVPIINLPADLLIIICDFLQETSPHSVSSLAATCSWLYQHARYAQRRSVAVNIDKLEPTRRQLDLLVASDFLPAVRELRVVARRSSYHEPTMERIGGLMLQMTGLRDVHWEFAPIPPTVLDALRSLGSKVRLHASVLNEKDAHDLCGHILTSLINCQELHSLSIDFNYGDSDRGLAITQRLKKILQSCANLRHLSLDLHYPLGARVPVQTMVGYPGIGFRNGERPLCPLESLSIKDYPWGFPFDDANPYVVHSGGYPCDIPETAYWAQNFDWFALRKLEISNAADIALLAQVHQRLVGLKELSLLYPFIFEGVPDSSELVQKVPSMLETIRIQSLDVVDHAALELHRSTLKYLEIHQLLEAPNHGYKGRLADQDDIARLAQLPSLEHLGIDINRFGYDGWPSDSFAALAKAPRLQSLEIWFRLGESHRPMLAAKPVLTASDASDIFRDLYRQSHGRIRRLVVHSGAPWTGSLDYITDISAYWPRENATSFICEISERDDEAAAGVVRVTCPKLSRQENDRLHKILRDKDGVLVGVDGMSLAMRVALNGPLEAKEWMQARNDAR